MMLHKLLKRQLKKTHLTAASPGKNPQDWQSFIHRISTAYSNFDQDRYLLERSLEISSSEMKNRWNKINQLLIHNQRAIEYIKLQNETLKSIVKGPSLQVVLENMTKAISSKMKGHGFLFLVVSEDKKSLKSFLTFNLPEKFKEFTNIPINITTGFCGSSANRKVPVRSSNIAEDDIWKDYKEIPLSYHYKSCWSYPIRSENGALFATLSLFSQEEKMPHEDDNTTISWAIQLASFVFQKRLQKDTLKEQQMALIHASKKAAFGELASGITHQFKNPLTAIDLKIQQILVSQEKQTLSSEELSNALKNVRQTLSGISKSIKTLQNFAIDNTQVKKENTPIGVILNNALDLYFEKIKNVRIKLKVKIENNDELLYCNPLQITQACLNLISNSYEAICEKKDPWITVQTKSAKNKLLITITDSGNGIPLDLQSIIMGPFVSTKKLIGPGVGLGLTISKGIIKDHNGSLKYNLESKNTQFIITLPLLEKP